MEHAASVSQTDATSAWRSLVLAGVALIALGASTLRAQTPVGTAFTYQGQLKQAGLPVDDTADFEFSLWDAETGGAQVGPMVPVNNWLIEGGLFTVLLDFGEGVFTGDALWLEVSVRLDGGGEYTVLSPRQPLAATPCALYALSGPGSGGFWGASGNDIYNTNSGNVGIGTAIPRHLLDIQEMGGGFTDPQVKVKGYANGLPLGDSGGYLLLGKSRGNLVGEDLPTWPNDVLGVVEGFGINSSNTEGPAARMVIRQPDDEPGVDDVPGEIVFETSDGQNPPQERMKIESSGNVEFHGDVQMNGTLHGSYVDIAGQLDMYGPINMNDRPIENLGEPNSAQDAATRGYVDEHAGGLTLPYAGTTSTGGNAFSITNTDTGNGVYGLAWGSSGAGVLGVAGNTGDVENYGGYFEAQGSSGRGVYAEATGEDGRAVEGIATQTGASNNCGGFFKANGGNGIGVYGVASHTGDYYNYGGAFRAEGQSGCGVEGIAVGSSNAKGVLGTASYSGEATNYGGHFSAHGSTGRGVYGLAENTGYAENHGGHFSARGSSGRGVYAEATGESGRAVEGIATHAGETVQNTGAYFEARGGNGIGVYGRASNTTGDHNYGGVFKAQGTSGMGVEAWGNAYDFYAAGPGTDYGSSSSIRWKSNVRPIDDPLDKVLRLRGVYFDWDRQHGGHHDVGMIAEEVGDVLPEIVDYEENGVHATGMDYSRLTPLLVEAVKALKREADGLREQNANLEARLAAIEKVVGELDNAQDGGAR